jgi:hypothetical protein
MRIRWGAVVAIGVLVVVIAGAVVAGMNGDQGEHAQTSSLSAADSGGSVKAADGAANASGSPAAPDVAREEGVATTPATGLGGLPTPELRAHVVKRATLELEVGRRKGRTTVHQMIDAVGLVGGFVESTEQDGGRARLTVRVPAQQFDATLDRMLALGRERGLHVQGQDVSGAVTDLDARLRNLRAQEVVLLDLMRKAANISDSIAVQQQLSQNQEQIEQLDGQRRALADQTTFATIAVSITPHGAPAAATDSPASLASAWSDAVDALLAVTGGVLIVLGALLPILLIGGAGVLVWRVVGRRQRRARTAAPAAG